MDWTFPQFERKSRNPRNEGPGFVRMARLQNETAPDNLSLISPEKWFEKLRTRSTTTRDRNLQFRGAVSTDFFFSGIFFLFSPGLLWSLARKWPQNVEKVARFPGGEKGVESCHVSGCHGFFCPDTCFETFWKVGVSGTVRIEDRRALRNPPTFAHPPPRDTPRSTISSTCTVGVILPIFLWSRHSCVLVLHDSAHKISSTGCCGGLFFDPEDLQSRCGLNSYFGLTKSRRIAHKCLDLSPNCIHAPLKHSLAKGVVLCERTCSCLLSTF